MKTILYLAMLLAVILFGALGANAQDAKEIVRKADTKFNGEKSSYSEMTMTIVRPKYKRSIDFKNWTEGRDKALTLITAPAKEAGQSFLRDDNNMWSWNPTIQRLIKLPPSMMSQGWMGSDYSNDDILKESSIVVDFDQTLKGSEMIDGMDCYKIELLPHADADVVWGKIIMWISKDEYLQLKVEYYDEEGLLVKTHLASDIKSFDDRRLPSRMEIIPTEEPDNRTIVTISSMKFNMPLDANFFSQQNMKRIR
jgi:outer membrane lipoprotein-sorting protein